MFRSHPCLSCRRAGTRTRPLASFLGECSPYRPHSVFSVLTCDVTGSRQVMLTKAVYHSSFSATVKSRHSKWTKQNDTSHVERARLRQARMRDGAIVGRLLLFFGREDGWRAPCVLLHLLLNAELASNPLLDASEIYQTHITTRMPGGSPNRPSVKRVCPRYTTTCRRRRLCVVVPRQLFSFLAQDWLAAHQHVPWAWTRCR